MATNIIERLFIEVGLDFSKLATEADKAIAKGNKLEESLSKTEDASGKANKALGDLVKSKAKAATGAENLAKGFVKAAKVMTGFFAALMTATGLNKLINEVQRANNELYFLEKNLGMSAKTIKAWQGAAAASGGTAEGMTASLKGLSRSMNDFVIMGDTSMLPYFNALGVSMVDSYGKVRNLDDVMLDLSDSLSRMDRKQAYSIGAAMGLDEGTLNTLLQGRDAMQEMLDIQNSMYHSSEKELEASRELSKQQAILSAHWESLKTMIANALIPILLKLTKVVNEWMGFIQRNERAVRHVFEALAFIIGLILIPLFGKALMAALAFIAPFAPFILVVAALSAAFIALYDDYKTWAEGGKSLFDWSWFQKMIDGSTFSVKGLKDAFKELAQDVVNFVMPSLRDALDVISKIKSGDFAGALASLTSLYMRPVEAIADAGHWAVEKAANGVDAVAGVDKNDPSSISAKVKSDKRIGSRLGDKVRDAVGYDGAGKAASNANPQNLSLKGASESGLKNGTLYLSEQDIEDIIKVTDTEVVKFKNQQVFEAQTRGVVDTILNRVASGRWGKSVRGVVNAKSQFTKINGPKGYRTKDGRWIDNNPYGAVQNMPSSHVNKRTRAAVLEHLKNRANGEKSSVADHLNYANPYVSDAKNRREWVDAMYADAKRNNRVFGTGTQVHGHGTTSGLQRYRPGNFSVNVGGTGGNLMKNANQASQMVDKNQQISNKQNVTNNNQKYVDVKIDKVSVQSSSSTVTGTTGDALKGVASNVNQLITGLS